MIVKIHTENEDYKKWSKENGSVFSNPEYLNIFNENLRLYVLTNKDNKIEGCFFYSLSKKYGHKIIKNLPFTPHIGPFFSQRSAKRYKNQSQVKKNLQSMIDHFNSIGYRKILKIRTVPELHDSQIFSWNNYNVTPYYTYHLSLNDSQEKIWNNLSSIKRNDIRKAIKDGIEVHESCDYNYIFDFVKLTYKRKKIQLNENILKKILFDFADKSNSFSYVAFNTKKQPIAATFILYDTQKAYYLLGGYDANNSHHGAVSYAIWESIKKAKTMNIPVFDFEGSMLPKVEKVFREFGGRITPYYMISKSYYFMECLLRLKGNTFF